MSGATKGGDGDLDLDLDLGAQPARLLAVCAHPDDESFGLGAVLASLTGSGVATEVLCFTRGEASTLGEGHTDLGAVRGSELAAAAAVLGANRATLLDYPDGGLDGVALDDLVEQVRRHARVAGARTLLVFDEGGITGHPDHRRATAAALAAAEQDDLIVLAWSIPNQVAMALNDEFGAGFVGRSDEELDLALVVDRDAQRKAIACHASQSADNPVLWRRLELLGDLEHLRYLRRSGD